MFHRSITAPRAAAWALAAAAWALAAAVATADDRDLLRDSEGNPYAFIIMDTSGSMNWTSACTEVDAALDIDPWDGRCTRECVLDAAVCDRFDPGGGCVQYNVRYDADNPPTYWELITDADDGSGGGSGDGSVAVAGSWATSTAGSYVGSEYLHDGNTGKGSKSVTFSQVFPETGFYHLYLYYEANAANAQNVPVTIVHADGQTKVRLDQRRNSQEDAGIDSDAGVDPEHYNYVGTYRFTAGSTGTVKIDNANTNGRVVVDSVRFFAVSEPAGVSCVRAGHRFRQPVCPKGDCFAPAGGDDPSSKMFQAREALFQVLDETPDVNFGFATYEQDQSRVQGKHWLYRVRQKLLDGITDQSFFTELAAVAPDPASEGTPQFPVPDSQWVFGLGPDPGVPGGYDSSGLGDGWDCQTDIFTLDPEGRTGRIGCEEGRPAASPPRWWAADADNRWEMERARRIPKLGIDGDAATVLWYRNPSDTSNANYTEGQVYKVTVDHPAAASAVTYGAPTIKVSVTLHKCTGLVVVGFDGSGTPILQPGCGAALSTSTTDFLFDLVTDYVSWEGDLSRPPMRQQGFFDQQRTIDHSDDEVTPANGNDCEGLEPNDDRDAAVSDPVTDPALAAGDDDAFPSPPAGSLSYTYKWPTLEDADGRGALLNVGDWVPLDWQETQRELIMGRMAPNLYDPTSGDFDPALGAPDFRTAVYWNDAYQLGDDASDADLRKLRLKQAKQSALLPFGNTPLAASLADFGAWYGDGTTGWSALAAAGDNRWECRNVYTLFLTDGNETCGGDPCDAAEELLDEGVKTYVVGFGVQQDCTDGIDNDQDGVTDGFDPDCVSADPDAILSETKLGCMAVEGGTENPILPRNKEELVEALKSIFSQIIPIPKTFASASIPALQSSSADRIFLSSFVPLPDESVWPGRIDAFRRPLPLTADNKPDTERACGAGRQSACHLWEAGERLLSQAEINEATLATLQVEDSVLAWSNELKIGDTATTRRVFFPQANLSGRRPSELVLFRPPLTHFVAGSGTPDSADLEDLAEVLAPAAREAFLMSAITDETLQAEVNEIIVETLLPKDLGEASVSFGGRPTYLLGDVFHSDPVVVTSPNDFTYFAEDLCGRIQPEGVPNNCIAGVDRGYRQFTDKHVWRRQMLVSATNDGQLHFFDAGVLVEGEERLDDGQLREFKVYSDGTGGELFSYMPRLTMPVVREQALGNRHIYSLDGTLALRDVFIDPITDNSGNIDPDERQWRTVLLAGLREAGDILESGAAVSEFYSGYFALDITQPDKLDSDFLPDPHFVRPSPSDAIDVTELKLPSCLDFDYGGDGHQKDATGCAERFPMELWTFTDAVDNHAIGPPFLDEDANGVRDLGDTWSTPIVGQIALCAPGASACDPDDPDDDEDLITKHVAIFGGGLDPDHKSSPERGNWLYMVDVETGEAIYKRQLEGAATAPPAVLDVDRDGIFDVIYQATTAGFVYKVDLNGRDAGGDLPDLAFEDVLDTNGVTHSNEFLRVDDFVGAGKPRGWDPYKILKTANGIPIYFAPAAFFIPETGHYGLAIGAGEREDLWEETHLPGRFYVIVDPDIPPPTAIPDSRAALACETRVPIEDACLNAIAWDSDPAVVTMGLDDLVQDNVLLNVDSMDDKQGGWVMTFPDDFRMTSTPFVVSSVLIFSQFEPMIFASGGVGTPTCASTGITRAFVVQVQNANPLARLSAADQGSGGGTSPSTGALKAEDRYLETPEFTTAPFVERTATKNPPSSGGPTLLDLVEEDVENGVREALIDLFPRGSRFNKAYGRAIGTLRNSTGVTVFVTIPVAIYPADWGDP